MSRESEIRALRSFIAHLEDLELEIDECGSWEDLEGIARERATAESELEYLER